MRRFLLNLALLCGVWLLALGRLSWGDLGMGLVISAALLLLLDAHLRPVANPPLGRRLVAFVPFFVAVVWDVVARTWDVVVIVLGLRPAVSGYMEVPIGSRTPIGVAVTGLLVTLAPGSVLIDVDWEAGLILFHMFDTSDPAATRGAIERFYERYQRPVFP